MARGTRSSESAQGASRAQTTILMMLNVIYGSKSASIGWLLSANEEALRAVILSVTLSLRIGTRMTPVPAWKD